MRQLCRSVTVIALLAALLVSCGSTTGDDRLVLRFIEFNGDGLTQADAVNSNSANVDVVPSVCQVDEFGNPTSFEVFTQTIINAVFMNEESTDILLQNVHVDTGSSSGLSPFDETISANVIGGRCSNAADQSCASGGDCVSVGGGSLLGTCVHTETTVSAILLFDFLRKAQAALNPVIFGVAQNVTITFTGTDDRGRTFTVTTGYVATFDNFDNCMAPTGG
jgi:hypothetical protein